MIAHRNALGLEEIERLLGVGLLAALPLAFPDRSLEGVNTTRLNSVEMMARYFWPSALFSNRRLTATSLPNGKAWRYISSLMDAPEMDCRSYPPP